VDGVDLATWKTGFGATDSASHIQGDADGNRDVDGTDFLIWQRQLGSATTTALPEPATLRLIVAGVLAMVSRRCKVCHKLMRV
jgi:hypothetical protein